MATGPKAVPDPPKKTDHDTERVVLVQAIFPAGAMPSSEEAKGLITKRNGDAEDPVVVCWIPVVDRKGEVRIFKGTKREAIEQFAGKGADERPGVYKAPNASAWRGQRRVVLPEKPKPEALWEE